MQAILLKEPGDPSKLYFEELSIPEIKEGELLVEVKASALNRADILQRQGKYPPPAGASEIIGLEFAGVVKDPIGSWKAGDRVMGILSGGGYAQYVNVPLGQLMPIPSNLSFEQAAAIPEVFLTAYQALYWHAEITAGTAVLIHAAASGVGTAAIQLSRLGQAKEIIATAGSQQKLQVCSKLGATACINYKQEDFSKRVREITNQRGADIILDFIGAPYWERNLESLAVDGSIVLIASMGGSTIEKASLAKLLQKRAKLIATTLRSRSNDYKARLTKEFSEFALKHFESETLVPVIDRVLSWREVKAAHELMESNQNIGKIVLKVD